MTLTEEQRDAIMSEFKNALDLLYMDDVEHDGKTYTLLMRDRACDYFENALCKEYLNSEEAVE